MAGKQAVMKSSWPPYPASRGFYSRSELSYLAGCLGFPSALFERGFLDPLLQADDGSTLTAGGRVSESALLRLLDSGILDSVLEKVFDGHPAEYNVKVIKKAVALLRRKAMTMAELSRARVGFELYSCEDGSGMPANLVAVMQAMKFLERVMSPTRMGTEIQKQQLHTLTPTRIQLYEFFDLVAMCERTDAAEKRMKSSSSLESADSSSDSSSDISLPDFEQLLMTRDQKIVKFLDDSYASSLYREVRPSPATLDADHIVSNAPRRKLLCLAKEESRAITPSLERSQSQLHRARNGLYVFSSRQHSCVSATSHRRPGSLQHSQTTPVSLSPRHQDRTKPRQVLSLNHRSRSETAPQTEMEHHSLLLLGHKSPQIRFQRAPQIKLPPSRKTSRPKPLVLNSHDSSSSSCSSRPNSRHKRTQSSDSVRPATRAATSLSPCNDETEHELSTVIDSLCVESVVRARSAVKSSMSCLSHRHRLRSSHKEEPYPEKKDYAAKKTPSTLLPTRSRHTEVEPVVTTQDLTVQQGLIDNLEWMSLRRKNRYGISKSLKAQTSAAHDCTQ